MVSGRSVESGITSPPAGAGFTSVIVPVAVDPATENCGLTAIVFVTGGGGGGRVFAFVIGAVGI